MSLDNKPIYTGGCQCGAIRFRVEGKVSDASICHCRMCQKAFGNFYAPLASVRGTHFQWTRGEPKRFQSSNHVRRGFCAECGTPLTYEAPDGVAIPAMAIRIRSHLLGRHNSGEMICTVCTRCSGTVWCRVSVRP